MEILQIRDLLKIVPQAPVAVLHHLIGQLRPSVFIHDSLIIHGSGARNRTSCHIRGHHRTARYKHRCSLPGKNGLKLFFERLYLVFLRPFHMSGGTVTVYGSRADFRYQERLSRPFRFVLYPLIKFIQIILHRNIMVPFGINVIGYHLRISRQISVLKRQLAEERGR